MGYQTLAPFQYKDQSMGIPMLKIETVETVLSLTWESLYWYIETAPRLVMVVHYGFMFAYASRYKLIIWSVRFTRDWGQSWCVGKTARSNCSNLWHIEYVNSFAHIEFDEYLVFDGSCGSMIILIAQVCPCERWGFRAFAWWKLLRHTIKYVLIISICSLPFQPRNILLKPFFFVILCFVGFPTCRFDEYIYCHYDLHCINLWLLMAAPSIYLHMPEVVIWSSAMWDLQEIVGRTDVGKSLWPAVQFVTYADIFVVICCYFLYYYVEHCQSMNVDCCAQ